MKIKPMLMRLQNALGRDDLMEQMLLFSPPAIADKETTEAVKSINLIVGYTSSPKSHTALDISLLIAHQTRIATNATVTVQAVYVQEENRKNHSLDVSSQETLTTQLNHLVSFQFPASSTSKIVPTRVLPQTNKFAKAERILWEARCLAQEWQSSFKAHLRFGCVAQELKKVVISEAAYLLLLGCNSAQHPLVQKLGPNFPCPVLGIPHCIDNE